MKKAFCLNLVLAAIALFMLSQTARAQEEFVYGYAGVLQDGFPETNGAIIGLSVTGATYGIAAYYDQAHLSTLQENGVTIAQGYVQSYPEVYNFTVAPIHAGSLYQQFTDHIEQVVTTYFCGTPFDPFGFSYWAYGFYGETSTWDPFPSVCISYLPIYIGYTQAQTQGQNQQQQICPDTCTPCKAERSAKIHDCEIKATVCELAAFGAYETAVNSCNNQTFCQPQNANFNAEACQNCKNSAKTVLYIATGACAVPAVGCFLTLPDCDNKVKVDCKKCSEP